MTPGSHMAITVCAINHIGGTIGYTYTMHSYAYPIIFPVAEEH